MSEFVYYLTISLKKAVLINRNLVIHMYCSKGLSDEYVYKCNVW